MAFLILSENEIFIVLIVKHLSVVNILNLGLGGIRLYTHFTNASPKGKWTYFEGVGC